MPEQVKETPQEPRIPDPGEKFDIEKALAVDTKPAGEKAGDKAKPAEKSELEKRLDTLEKESKADKARIEELAASERYWADRARGSNKPAPEVEDEEEEQDDEKPAAESPFEGEKPDKFLDDLSVDGLKALRKRGVITEDQLLEAVGNVEKRLLARVDEKLETSRKHSATDAQLAKFPDLKDPKSELFKTTRAVFLQMVEDDPAMKNSPAALLSAARLAQEKLDMQKKLAEASSEEKQSRRRERIENQAGERSPVGEEGEDDGGDALSPQAREVVKSLTDYLDPIDQKTGKGRDPRKAEELYRRNMVRNGR